MFFFIAISISLRILSRFYMAVLTNKDFISVTNERLFSAPV